MDIKSDNQIVKEEVTLFKGFKRHLLIFLTFLAILWVTWFVTGRSANLWALYPSVVWGIVLAIHFLIAYRGIEKRNKEIE